MTMRATQPFPYYTIQTEHNREVVARAAIQSIGFTVFLPQVRKEVTHARKTSVVFRPLFPGYLFARFDVADFSWRRISREHGVRTVLRLSGQDNPVRVPESVIADIRSQMDYGKSGFGAVPESKLIDYTEGQTLTVEYGAFAQFPALFQRREEDRVVAMLTIFNRSFEMSFDEAQVVAA